MYTRPFKNPIDTSVPLSFGVEILSQSNPTGHGVCKMMRHGNVCRSPHSEVFVLQAEFMRGWLHQALKMRKMKSQLSELSFSVWRSEVRGGNWVRLKIFPSAKRLTSLPHCVESWNEG